LPGFSASSSARRSLRAQQERGHGHSAQHLHLCYRDQLPA
jgi:hypothetical protein